MKKLTFEVRRNLNKTSKIYVKSADRREIYGSFSSDNPEAFDGWPKLNGDEAIELRHYMKNLNAVQKHLGIHLLDEQADYRLRLPLKFIDLIDKISAICEKNKLDFDIYEPMIVSIIQELKISSVKLEKGKGKEQVLDLLDKMELAEYKKMDYSRKIKSVFSELLSIKDKSEKLHEQAKKLFNKDKSYSPRAIEGMAIGETEPARWLVCCAISVIAEEKPHFLDKILLENDLFNLFAKPLIDNDQQSKLNFLMKKYNFSLEKFIKNN